MATLSLNITIRNPKQTNIILIITNTKKIINKDSANINNTSNREYKIRRVGGFEKKNKVKIQSRI